MEFGIKLKRVTGFLPLVVAGGIIIPAVLPEFIKIGFQIVFFTDVSNLLKKP